MGEEGSGSAGAALTMDGSNHSLPGMREPQVLPRPVGDSSHSGHNFGSFGGRHASYRQRLFVELQERSFGPVTAASSFTEIRSRCAPRKALAVVEAVAAYAYLWILPYQAGFETDRVSFSFLYVVGYALDALLLLLRTPVLTTLLMRRLHRLHRRVRAVHRGHEHGVHAAWDSTAAYSPGGNSPVDSPQRKLGAAAGLLPSPDQTTSLPWLVVVLLSVLPYDAPLWGSHRQGLIPVVRLTRLAFALPRQLSSMTKLERSQAVSFTASRSFRVLHFFFWITHVLGCALHFFSRAAESAHGHYAFAPWHESQVGVKAIGGGGSETLAPSGLVTKPGTSLGYLLRSHYWSMMTLTTTGHVDIINADGSFDKPGEDWEFVCAVCVVVLATFVYIYVNANFTSLILRLNTQLESYRTRLQGVDRYLSRNRVSRELRTAVKRHFSHEVCIIPTRPEAP